MEDALEQEEWIRKQTNEKRHENTIPKNKNSDIKYRNSSSSSNSIDRGSYADNSQLTNYGQSNAGYNSFQKKVNAANKKLGKAVQSLRNRVAAACQSYEIRELKALLIGDTLPFSTSTKTVTTTSAVAAVTGGSKYNDSISNSNKSKFSMKIKQSSISFGADKTDNKNVPAAKEILSEEDWLVQH
jgi:hypothetical protein